MSATEALATACAAGVTLEVDGDDLVLSASTRPPASVLDFLSRHKTGVLELLRRGRDGWSAEDWLAFFDERAGVAEHDGGLSRQEAEIRAFACCVAECLNRNPVRSPPDRCLGCGGVETEQASLLPFGTETTGHAWLHGRCWGAWRAGRKAEAVAALKAIGIEEKSIDP